MLQYHYAKFSHNKISPICKLCGEEEDREHFLLECKTLEENKNGETIWSSGRGSGGWYMDSRTKWAAHANHLGLHLMWNKPTDSIYESGFSANWKSHAKLLLCVTSKENWNIEEQYVEDQIVNS